ncbi:hypothetical protein PMO31116_04665 [Pandoraea morbifera]|uniref:Uncharacterized protein n=1 Tax=Pandoraea morbifera TaxID=2508300 RepID=A0A5E4YQU3_9BURK|nr:hypothetical protein [Pandoraea morbifera]VVE51151.1 hypothetical protein PMO31116_04665 [Pandoraea morbifera]
MTELSEWWEQKKREVERQLPRDVREAKRKSRFECINGKLRLKTMNPRREVRRALIRQATMEHFQETLHRNLNRLLAEKKESE